MCTRVCVQERPILAHHAQSINFININRYRIIFYVILCAKFCQFFAFYGVREGERAREEPLTLRVLLVGDSKHTAHTVVCVFVCL